MKKSTTKMQHQSSDKLAISKEEDKCNNFAQSPWLKQTSEKIDKDLYAINNSSGQKIPMFKKHDPVPLKGNSDSLNVFLRN